jgi:hypothetical protein
MAMIIFHKMNCFENKYSTWLAGGFMWCLTIVAIGSIMVCRSHYTVDIIMGLYMSHYLSDQYFLRADGVMPNRWGARWVRYFEGHDVTQKGLSERATSMASFAGGSSGSFGNLDTVRVGMEKEVSGLDMTNLQRNMAHASSYGEMGLSVSEHERENYQPSQNVTLSTTESPFHPASMVRQVSGGPPTI